MKYKKRDIKYINEIKNQQKILNLIHSNKNNNKLILQDKAYKDKN